MGTYAGPAVLVPVRHYAASGTVAVLYGRALLARVDHPHIARRVAWRGGACVAGGEKMLVARAVARERVDAAREVRVGADFAGAAVAQGLNLDGRFELALKHVAAAAVGAELGAEVGVAQRASVAALRLAAGRQAAVAPVVHAPVGGVRPAAVAPLAGGHGPALMSAKSAVLGSLAILVRAHGAAAHVALAHALTAAGGGVPVRANNSRSLGRGGGSGGGDQRERRQPAHLRCTWLAGVARWSAAKRRWRTHALPRPLVPGYVLSVSSALSDRAVVPRMRDVQTQAIANCMCTLPPLSGM